MNTNKYLRDLAVGCTGQVVGYQTNARSYKAKLLAMGLTPGTEFTVIRRAPLGDPIEIQIRGFKLSLRKDEADALFVREGV
ncbi:MAG: ferrous iron transport protein A [Stigonema ocellatum SAG 48.90 = DSM 106950]|nr:ferrous iron transport protein A [Stigonema ocellatum SAG 48.90 = DSM 106950]